MISNTPKQNKLSLRVIQLIAFTFALSACTSVKRSSSIQQPDRTTPSSSSTTQSDLKLCKTHVSNPPASQNRQILRSSANACVAGVNILVAPAPKACLSSGYGSRGGKLHSGLDYQSKPTGSVVAAGAGKIINIENRVKDYGHWVIIDHGNGIYSSYAHLEKVDRNLKVGQRVKKGQRLGKMGKSGASTNAIHLHFEVRKGNYNTRKKWWGLTPINLFEKPEFC